MTARLPRQTNNETTQQQPTLRQRSGARSPAGSSAMSLTERSSSTSANTPPGASGRLGDRAGSPAASAGASAAAATTSPTNVGGSRLSWHMRSSTPYSSVDSARSAGILNVCRCTSAAATRIRRDHNSVVVVGGVGEMAKRLFVNFSSRDFSKSGPSKTYLQRTGLLCPRTPLVPPAAQGLRAAPPPRLVRDLCLVPPPLAPPGRVLPL